MPGRRTIAEAVEKVVRKRGLAHACFSRGGVREVCRMTGHRTKQFTQPDSIVPEPGNPQSLNRYSYVYNNPLRYADPTGHEADEWMNCFVLGCGGSHSQPPQTPTPEENWAVWQTISCTSSVYGDICQAQKEVARLELAYWLNGDPCANACGTDAIDFFFGSFCVIATGNSCHGENLGKGDRAIASVELALLLGSPFVKKLPFARFGDDVVRTGRGATAFAAGSAANWFGRGAAVPIEGIWGVSEIELRRLIPSSFIPESASSALKGGEAGIKFVRPGSSRSDVIRIMAGDPTAVDMFHAGPRAYISSGGRTFGVPLEGNLILEFFPTPP